MFPKSDRNQTSEEGDSWQTPQSHSFPFSPGIVLHGRPRTRLVIVSITCTCSAVEWLVGEQLEALSDCFFPAIPGSTFQTFHTFPNTWMDSAAMALSQTPGETWPLQAVEFISIIFILAINKRNRGIVLLQKRGNIQLILQSLLFFHLAYVRNRNG